MQSVDKAMQLLIRYGCMHLQTALQFLRPIIIDLSVGRFSVAATYERESKRDQNYAISLDKKPRVQTRETFRNEDNSWWRTATHSFHWPFIKKFLLASRLSASL